MNIRLVKFLEKYQLLSPYQFGFRRGLSTEDAILALTSSVTETLDKGGKCLAVFLDLKKAFDTVSIPILLHKLEKIGIRGSPLLLFKDYLSDRKQSVKIDKYTSLDQNIIFGVPQGSVLGPTLFLIYINDLTSMAITERHILSYADDIVLVFSGKTWECVQKSAENSLVKVASWLNTNLLTLNTEKTNYICFSIYDSTQPKDDFEIKIHKCLTRHRGCLCAKINKVQQTKYLGIILDQRLSWHVHSELIMNRTRKLIWIFKTLRHITTKKLK